MKAISKATMRPWIYDIHDGSFYIFTKSEMEMVADGTPDSPGIARMRGTGRGADAEEQEANAELIVRAVNSHADLLEACKAVIEAAQTDSDTCAICLCDLAKHASGCVIDSVKSAIQKATKD